MMLSTAVFIALLGLGELFSSFWFIYILNGVFFVCGICWVTNVTSIFCVRFLLKDGNGAILIMILTIIRIISH